MSWRSRFGLIPGPAKIVAALAFMFFFFEVCKEYRASGFATLIGLAGGTLAAAYFLLAGRGTRIASRSAPSASALRSSSLH